MNPSTSDHSGTSTDGIPFTSLKKNTIQSKKQDHQQENNNDKNKQYNTGHKFYNKGEYAKALSCFRKAARQGSSQAMNMIGNMYFLQQGVEQSNKKSLTWYYRSAEYDRNRDAQNKIGEFYQCGVVVPKNIQTAIVWYKKSSYQGSPDAQYNLARIYENEHEVKDLQRAVYWYKIAADNGEKEAEHDLKRLKEKGYYPTDEEKDEGVIHKEPNVSSSSDARIDEDQTNVEETSTSANMIPSAESKAHKKSSKKLQRKKAKKLQKSFQLKLTIFNKRKQKFLSLNVKK